MRDSMRLAVVLNDVRRPVEFGYLQQRLGLSEARLAEDLTHLWNHGTVSAVDWHLDDQPPAWPQALIRITEEGTEALDLQRYVFRSAASGGSSPGLAARLFPLDHPSSCVDDLDERVPLRDSVRLAAVLDDVRRPVKFGYLQQRLGLDEARLAENLTHLWNHGTVSAVDWHLDDQPPAWPQALIRITEEGTEDLDLQRYVIRYTARHGAA